MNFPVGFQHSKYLSALVSKQLFKFKHVALFYEFAHNIQKNLFIFQTISLLCANAELNYRKVQNKIPLIYDGSD